MMKVALSTSLHRNNLLDNESHELVDLAASKKLDSANWPSAEDAMLQAVIAVEGLDCPYQDFLHIPVSHIVRQMQAPKNKRKGPRGGVSEPFPVKLYEMLHGVEQEGLTHVVSWMPHGRCFVVHVARTFVDDIMPRYFKQSKLTSFQRQLNLYGFARVTSGRDRGAHYHPLFLRGRPDICKIMLRTRVKGGAPAITPSDAKVNESASPMSFYALPYCPDLNAGPMDRENNSGQERRCSMRQVRSDEGSSNCSSTEKVPDHRQVTGLEFPNYAPDALEPTPINYSSQPESFNLCKYDSAPLSNNRQHQQSSNGLLDFQNYVKECQKSQHQNFISASPEQQIRVCAMGQPPMLPTSMRDPYEVVPFQPHDDGSTCNVGTFEGQEFQFLDPDNIEAYESSLIGV